MFTHHIDVLVFCIGLIRRLVPQLSLQALEVCFEDFWYKQELRRRRRLRAISLCQALNRNSVVVPLQRWESSWVCIIIAHFSELHCLSHLLDRLQLPTPTAQTRHQSAWHGQLPPMAQENLSSCMCLLECVSLVLHVGCRCVPQAEQCAWISVYGIHNTSSRQICIL